ncbi:MAG: HAD family hydrolase [Coprobacillus sp.]
MEKQLIFFDIDGTLLDEKTFTVPSSTLNAIHQAQENGHLCFINTGRPISTIDQVILDIGFDGFVCGCGTYIEYHGKQIFHEELSEEKRRGVIQKSFEYNIESVLEGKQGAFFRNDCSHPFMVACRNRYQEEGFPTFKYSKEDNIVFDKFAASYDETANIESFKNFLEPEFEVIQRDVGFIEVIPSHCSKATGIQKLVDYLDTTLDNTISIGDSTNDLSMLTFTAKSVAMGNSNPILFDIVTFVTTDITDNGIENALKHYHVI